MSETWLIVIITVASYLIGSISMTRLITKIVAPDTDIEDVHFSVPGAEDYHIRNISATTASLQLGSKVGGTIAILDALKGMIPVLIVRVIFPGHYYYLIAAVFIIVGHNWSIFHRFTGGAGLSASYGAFFVVSLLGTLISAFSGMLIGFIVFKDMMIAFASGPLLFLLWLIIFKGDWPHIIFGIVINIIIILKLLPDMINLIKNRDSIPDISGIMDQTGMGRGMKKMMKWMGIDPEKKKETKQ